MTLSASVISGIVQGLTEFFPVSSSGHLVLLHTFFGIREPQLALDIAVHLGTMAAVAVYFWRDILRLFTVKRAALVFIIAGTVPAVIVGFLVQDAAERFFAMPRLVSAMLILTGIWLGAGTLAGRYYAKRRARRRLGWGLSLMIGLAQAAAIMPGVSRSGATIATGLGMGMEPDEAFRFSFLLSLPAVGGAAVLKLPAALRAASPGDIAGYVAGAVVAACTGIIVLGALSKAVRADKLYLFGIYCAAVGGAALLVMR